MVRPQSAANIPNEAIPLQIDPELTPTTFLVAVAPPEARMDVLREMLAAIEDATPGGQRYLMTKLLVLFRREASRPDVQFSVRQRHVLLLSLDQLEHEASRIAPDVATFERRAQILVDLFAIL